MGVADHLQAIPGFFSQDDPTRTVRTLESVGAVSVNSLFNVNDKALARQIFGYFPTHKTYCNGVLRSNCRAYVTSLDQTYTPVFLFKCSHLSRG